MSTNMPNIKLLRDDLRNHGWVITAFPFEYNNIKCHVIFEDIKAINEHINSYFIAQLTFIDLANNERKLETLANTNSFSASITDIRNFFNIEYCKEIADFLSSFYQYFQSHSPSEISELNNELKRVVVQKINQREGTPDADYCYDVRRNGVDINGRQRHRTPYNSNKTKILYPELYNYFKDDNTISFYYSPNQEDERTLNELILKFIDCNKR